MDRSRPLRLRTAAKNFAQGLDDLWERHSTGRCLPRFGPERWDLSSKAIPDQRLVYVPRVAVTWTGRVKVNVYWYCT
jgi:hypothetical protein